MASQSSCALAELAAGPGRGGDHGAADQHFAVGADFDFAARQGLADGAAGHVEGMVEGDQRSGFGHAVALHDDEAERIPELFDQRR